MKKITLLLTIICSFAFLSNAQEVEILQSFGSNAAINMRPGDGGGVNTLSMLNTVDFTKSQWRIIFDKNELPPPMGPIERAWEAGVGNDFNVDPHFFTISRYDFILDFIATRSALVISDSTLYTGIGENDPKAKLHVFHEDSFSDGINTPAMVIGRHSSPGAAYGYLTVDKPTDDLMDNIARFRDNGATQVEINRNANTYQLEVFGDALASGGMWISSDKKLKRNIQLLSSGLQDIRRLRPSSYYYKVKDKGNHHLPEERQFGLIAQDLKKVFPHLVREGESWENEDVNSANNDKILSINYTGLIPVLISSVQELDKKLTDKNTQLVALQKDHELLLTRLERLEAVIRDITKE